MALYSEETNRETYNYRKYCHSMQYIVELNTGKIKWEVKRKIINHTKIFVNPSMYMRPNLGNMNCHPSDDQNDNSGL